MDDALGIKNAALCFVHVIFYEFLSTLTFYVNFIQYFIYVREINLNLLPDYEFNKLLRA